jgi:hypothetical protein
MTVLALTRSRQHVRWQGTLNSGIFYCRIRPAVRSLLHVSCKFNFIRSAGVRGLQSTLRKSATDSKHDPKIK